MTTDRATPASLKFVQTVNAIRNDPEGAEAAYLARFLIQCTLPHSDPGDVPVWTRRNGLYTLVIQPGWDVVASQSMGYPFGILPRLLLVWIVTEAKRTHSRKLYLGENLTDFMRELGLDPSHGGKRGDGERLRIAANRLFSARISFFEHVVTQPAEPQPGKLAIVQPRGDYMYTSDMQVAPERCIQWGGKRGRQDQNLNWNSWIEIGEKFYNAIIASTVPCDMRALKILKRSPLALDLYMLCNWIGYNLQKPEKFIAWTMLAQQMGVDYTDNTNLKKAIKDAIGKVRAAHPGLNVQVLAGYSSTDPNDRKKTGGLLIKRSRPAIAPRHRLTS